MGILAAHSRRVGTSCDTLRRRVLARRIRGNLLPLEQLYEFIWPTLVPRRHGQRRGVCRNPAVAAGDRLRAEPRTGARVPPAIADDAPTSIAGCWAHSSSISAAPSIPECSSPGRRSLMQKDFAPTWRARSRSSACPSSAIPAGTSSPDTTGSTASGPRRIVRSCSSAPGIRSRRTSSARTSSSTGAGSSAPSLCSGSTSAPARPKWRSPTSSTATSNAAPNGAICGARTATPSRTTCATGVSATRWTARGRSARCRRASMAARRATWRSRCA